MVGSLSTDWGAPQIDPCNRVGCGINLFLAGDPHSSCGNNRNSFHFAAPKQLKGQKKNGGFLFAPPFDVRRWQSRGTTGRSMQRQWIAWWWSPAFCSLPLLVLMNYDANVTRLESRFKRIKRLEPRQRPLHMWAGLLVPLLFCCLVFSSGGGGLVVCP